MSTLDRSMIWRSLTVKNKSNGLHELSIAENIIEIIRENLTSTVSVKSVKVRIGELANVVPDSLVFCFSAITKGTRLEATKLEIESTRLMGRCENCGTESAVEDFLFKCVNCGSNNLKIVSGNELQVVEMEVDDEIESLP